VIPDIPEAQKRVDSARAIKYIVPPTTTTDITVLVTVVVLEVAVIHDGVSSDPH
jgi:hypothetical protein